MIFRQPGYRNTMDVLKIVKQAAIINEIDTVIIASTSGETARKALKEFDFVGESDSQGQTRGDEDRNTETREVEISSTNRQIKNLIVVSHVAGFESPDSAELTPEVKAELEAAGAIVVTAAHSLGGIGRAARIKFGTYGTDELIAHALRLFGEGTKVAIEVAMMAADAGAVSTQQRLISIGGSTSGADSALIMQPANTHRFFDIRVDEILCKPAVSKAWFKQKKESESEDADR
ncbi:hypothetical protein [Acidaminobacter sp.]|uniref:hypothetical protein n=1 Tax=Acidaminobacter sp. TaxID=1872102 RepID=UPI001384BC55|nr:hypothetical protein [Acidaminobacter sp.]MDK9712384.1 hypothetical protein [Acidaminobacter sp.]MZQ97558.1 hypothetical protein [Acidaminobacter sp.]